MLQIHPQPFPTRAALVRRLRRWLEKPMLVLSFAWVALVIVQMVNPNLPYVEPLRALIRLAEASTSQETHFNPLILLFLLYAGAGQRAEKLIKKTIG